MDFRGQLDKQRLVPRVIVIFDQHLQPEERVARVESAVVEVLHQKRELAQILPHQPRVAKSLVIDKRLNEVVARIADRLLMVGGESR